MKRCGKVPFTGLEDHVQLIEKNNRLTHEVEKLKSADTAAILYESKFQEINSQNQKLQEMLKAARENIDE